MLNPSIVNIVSFFYPVGNTPAINLTQDLPPEEEAKILLLGCGDARNILFTAYCQSEAISRHLDITCCDIERAIVARNILLLTLLLDDTTGSETQSIWAIYYHIFLHGKPLQLLQTQAKKLYTLSSSLQAWHSNDYGRLLRFCDQGTWTEVREVWASYCAIGLGADEVTTWNKRFYAHIKKAKDLKTAFVGKDSVIFTGLRSAAPVGISAVKDLPKLYQQYWDTGTADGKPDAKLPNPMFGSLSTDGFTLHYGLDPLLGFHLATAYVPLTPDSPLNSKVPGIIPQTQRVVEAARVHFSAWASAFRKLASKNGILIRFFTGEALAFCHTLQHKHTGTSANWYRAPYQLGLLKLDSEDCGPGSGTANLLFNVIDTSNLVDHLGALNVLTATAPLLGHSVSASLYTESLVKRAGSHRALMESFLCGDLPSMSLLLGLFPCEYWTNATAIANADEGIFGAVSRVMVRALECGMNRQMHSRLAWKRTIPTPGSVARQALHFGEEDLAQILFQVYRKMFEHEDMRSMLLNMDIQKMRIQANPHYHRGSFASFLCYVKNTVAVTSWKTVMKHLLHLIETDSTLLMGTNYIQELYLNLHLMNVFTVETLSPSFNRGDFTGVLEGWRTWKDLPPVVCVTVKVPRSRLRVLTDMPPMKLTTPILHCLIQSPRSSSRQWQNVFSMVHLIFGQLTTFGERSCGDFALHINPDPAGWGGTSSLLVSFLVPVWFLLIEPKEALVAFGIQSTPHSSATFLSTLGPEMNLYETTLGNEGNVFITKHRPNQVGYAVVCDFPAADAGSHTQNKDDSIRTTFTAVVDRKAAKILALTGRVSFHSVELRTRLSNAKMAVETAQTSPYAITATVGKGASASHHELHFPVPILGGKSKVRIARKSGYVEVEAPLAGPLDSNSEKLMYPLFLLDRNRPPVVWGMPRLNVDTLPIIDLRKKSALEWITTHVSMQFSNRERTLRDTQPSHNDVRTNFKDGLFSMFMQYTGLQGQKASFFGINQPGGGGVHILIFVSCLRLDIGNHTVVLDAAILPLTDELMPKIRAFLAALTQSAGLCNIKVDAEELTLWKQTLPAMVERCRVWEHKETCEYGSEGRIPLSVKRGETPICSCGNGKMPKDFVRVCQSGRRFLNTRSGRLFPPLSLFRRSKRFSMLQGKVWSGKGQCRRGL